MKELLNRVKEKFPLANETMQRDDLVFITMDKIHAVEGISYLKDFEGFKHLVLLTAVDWLEDGMFQLTYLLNNPEQKKDIGVRVFISREDPVMGSSHQLWAQAATYQRELYEMFGITFPGSPGMEEPFILDGWDGPPPYRRDFDTLKYSQETYFPRPGRSSNDPAEYMKKKMYPEDP